MACTSQVRSIGRDRPAGRHPFLRSVPLGDQSVEGLDGVAHPPAAGSSDLMIALLSSVVDRLPYGVFVTDDQSRPRLLNRAAYAMGGDGFVHLKDGRLRGGAALRPGALQSAIAECCAGAPLRSVQLESLKAGGVLIALVDRLASPQARPDAGFAVVALFDPTRCPGADAGLLQQQYALTSAEARVAAEIMRGDGLPACARRLGVGLSTVRSHLKHIFDKTGTRRQAELVRLLLMTQGLSGAGHEPRDTARAERRTLVR